MTWEIIQALPRDLSPSELSLLYLSLEMPDHLLHNRRWPGSPYACGCDPADNKESKEPAPRSDNHIFHSNASDVEYFFFFFVRYGHIAILRENKACTSLIVHGGMDEDANLLMDIWEYIFGELAGTVDRL